MSICGQNVFAQERYESSTNGQFLYGKNLITVTLEHAGRYQSFSQFGFADFFYLADNNTGINIYTEWYPKVSIKAFDDNQRLLKEIFFGAGLNTLWGEEFTALMAGPVWHFNILTFNLFQFETYYYRQLNDPENTYRGTFQLTYSWVLPIPLSQKIKLLTRGFIDYIGNRVPGRYQIITQPQLLLDIGNFWNRPQKLYTGTEWNYWKNVNGVPSHTRSIVQFEVILFL